MIDGIDWIGDVVARESIDCGWVKGGAYRVATSAPQLARARSGLATKQARGYAEADIRFVTPRGDRGRGAHRGRPRRHVHPALRAGRPGATRARPRGRRASGAAS